LPYLPNVWNLRVKESQDVRSGNLETGAVHLFNRLSVLCSNFAA
jgi:hypothetical protein